MARPDYGGIPRRCIDAPALLMVCAALSAGCQILSLAEPEVIVESPPVSEPSELDRVLEKGTWQLDREWNVLALTRSVEIAPAEASIVTFRWKFAVPIKSTARDTQANANPDGLEPELVAKYESLWKGPSSTPGHADDADWDSFPGYWSLMMVRRGLKLPAVELDKKYCLAFDVPLAVTANLEEISFDREVPGSKKTVSKETRSAAAEAWCLLLASQAGDPEEIFAPAGRLLETSGLPEEIRGELFRGIARKIPPRQIPGLNDVMVRHESSTLATPLHLAAVEACVLHAWSQHIEHPEGAFDSHRWPDGLRPCRFAKDVTLRKLFGRWAALAHEPDALAILKSQRLDLDLGVREESVISLGLLPYDVARGELLAVMEKGTEPERAAAIGCLARGGSGDILRFVRDEAPRVRTAVARELARFPSRTSAVTLADLLRDRATDVQLAALEACDKPEWKNHGRVPLLLHALRVGALRTQMAAVAQLRTEWGLEPVFPLNGTFEERDAAVRQLALEHNVSTEVFTAFKDAGKPAEAAPEIQARQDDIRRLVRDYLHAPAKTESVSGDELKSLDAAAVAIIEQEAQHAVGPRAEFLYREILPRLHPAYAALLALESLDPVRRREAAKDLRAVAERGSLSASLLKRLLARLQTEQDRQVWQDVIAAVTPDALPEAAQIGLIALNSPWPDLRQFGCDYFERHPQPEYAAWILPRLQDTDRQIQLRAVRLLARCGNPAALDGYAGAEEGAGLRQLLSSADLQLRAETVLAMTTLGDTQAAQELLRQSYDPVSRQRELAVQAIGQTGQTKFLEHLLRLSWTEADRGVQIALLKSLEQLVPLEERPGLAPESSISDKITEWARWWENRQRQSAAASRTQEMIRSAQ